MVVLELSFNIMEIFGQELVLYDFPLFVFAYNIKNFFPHVAVHAWMP